MIEVMSFEIQHKRVEMLYDGIAYYIGLTFEQASEVMDDLILEMLEEILERRDEK